MAETRKILIVDDRPELLEMLASLFANESFEVVTAISGNEGLKTLEAHKIDLVLSDITMPGMDGIELTRHIRTNPKTADIPIILVTGRLTEEDVERSKEAGCDQFFAKPYRFKDLLVKIKTSLGDDQRTA